MQGRPGTAATKGTALTGAAMVGLVGMGTMGSGFGTGSGGVWC